MAHQHVVFDTTDVASYKQSEEVIRLSAKGPRGGYRNAEFLTPDQARDLISKLQLALDGKGETTGR
ncbi:hypothetical protein [Bradyrhizobium sp. DASA03007]|uniref:hypothetical protein n=1 Tax=unclassified Bradyrhizobium TaxID=2631580 RepID=UPI003F6ECF8A